VDLPSFDQSTWLALVAVLVATSLLAGLVAGLLGVGGGIVTVPILEYALHFTAMPPEATLHVAVATSLATIVPTAIASSRAHHARGSIDWALVHAWAVPMLLGSLIGSLLAAHAPVRTLAAIFGTIALVVALKMLLPTEHWRLAPQAPRGVAGSLVATTIGGISATMGIGGGTLAVPTLTVCGMPVHRAVGTAAFFGLLISIPGTLGYLLAQPPTALPSGTVGFVSLLGFAILAPGATLMAPLGARIAHGLSRRALSAAFGIFLLSVAARMLYRSMA
jgi:uncharacterized membrane protein YfcA